MVYIANRNAGALLSVVPSSKAKRGAPLFIDWRDTRGGDVVVGVDPGINGGLTALDASGKRVLFSAPMPTKETQGRGRIKRRVDGYALTHMLRGRRVTRAFVEDPGVVMFAGRDQIDPTTGKPRRVRSVSTIAALQAALAAVESMLDAFDIEQHRVLTVHWKKPLGLHGLGRLKSTARKRASLDLAERLWPSDFGSLRLKDDGQAEAALIALYGCRYWHSNTQR